MKRRTFIPLGMAALAGCQQSTSFDPLQTIRHRFQPVIVNLILRGSPSHCLERIEDMDHAGLAIRAVIEVNPEALKIAEGEGRKGTLGTANFGKGQHRHGGCNANHCGSLVLLGSASDASVVQSCGKLGWCCWAKTKPQ